MERHREYPNILDPLIGLPLRWNDKIVERRPRGESSAVIHAAHPGAIRPLPGTVGPVCRVISACRSRSKLQRPGALAHRVVARGSL
jgi:hypothetical protein